MVREEHDREDLLKEAGALVERAELLVDRWPDAVVAGFRRDGSASVYFGAVPVYHFNSRGELRRAYSNGLLFKAENGRLVSLRRQRAPGEVALIRHDLTDEETTRFLAEVACHLAALREAIAAAGFTLVGQVPESGDVVSRIDDWLTGLPLPPAVAKSPRAS